MVLFSFFIPGVGENALFAEGDALPEVQPNGPVVSVINFWPIQPYEKKSENSLE
jgi:hypothetical protein